MKRKCPVCKKTVRAPSDGKADEPDCLPFCSERCKLIDLGAWLEEEYKITSQVGPGEDEQAE
ncbi:MAG: DNA gyrase inhibitor YacG [Planctomycetota bacterium]|jgi:endogenous inhibitor of DNA gyrase (YacG/DUF329 family)